MNRTLFFCFGWLILFLVEISFSQNKAIEWLKKGINSNDPQEKIRCFEKSIELNPVLIEASFNLGLAYYHIENFNKAETAFERALRASPDDVDNSIKLKIVYELGKTYAKLGKYQFAKDAFLSIKDVAQDATSKSAVLGELAEINLKFKEFDQAIDNLNEIIKLNPANQSSFQAILDLANRLKAIHVMYDIGMTHFRNHEYEPAQYYFSEILKIDPHFKDVAEKLNQTKINLAKLSEQQVEAFNFEVSDSLSLNETENISTLKFVGDTYAKVQEVDDLEHLYNQGLAALTNDNWGEAINFFRRVITISPDYRDTNSRLLEATLGLESAREMDEVTKFYNQGLSKFNNGEWLEAIIEFERAKMLYPGYKDIELKIVEAKSHLQEIKVKNSSNLLAESNSIENQDVKITWILVGIFSLLPVAASCLFLSPSIRARYYLLQRKYDRACGLYERMILKHPGKMRIYITLANIYLVKNRYDDQALKVYQAVLNDNIDPTTKEKIVSIIANEYLKKNKIDQNSVNILTQALQTEIKKLAYPS